MEININALVTPMVPDIATQYVSHCVISFETVLISNLLFVLRSLDAIAEAVVSVVVFMLYIMKFSFDEFFGVVFLIDRS